MDYNPHEPISPIDGVEDLDTPNGHPGPVNAFDYGLSVWGPPTDASAAAFLRLPPEVLER
jgi:hypothetical protein